MLDIKRREFIALLGASGLLLAVKVRRARAQHSIIGSNVRFTRADMAGRMLIASLKARSRERLMPQRRSGCLAPRGARAAARPQDWDGNGLCGKRCQWADASCRLS
jgi:hypothetical protein